MHARNSGNKTRLCRRAVGAAAAVSALVLAANGFAQELVDAAVPVIVTNTGANVTVSPPAIGRGTGDETDVTAAAAKNLNIKLIARPEPEEVLAPPSSVSHRSRSGAAGGGA